MRLIGYWRNGDCIIGQHVRDTEVEVKAAVEAARMLREGREPEQAKMPVPKGGAGDSRDLDDKETAHYLRWRVYQNWVAMKADAPAAKAKRRTVKCDKAVSA